MTISSDLLTVNIRPTSSQSYAGSFGRWVGLQGQVEEPVFGMSKLLGAIDRVIANDLTVI